MLGVGFEPTRTNTGDLKSLPLDQLGHPSARYSHLIILRLIIFFCCVMTCVLFEGEHPVLLGRTSLFYWVELPLAPNETF